MTGHAIEIHPLSPARLTDFLGFFDGDAFADNPRWSSCYCQCFYEDHSQIDWKERTAAQNRQRACERTATADMQGYLAYLEGTVVGWCNAAPRKLLHALDEEPIADADQAGVILCFLVAPQHRGNGIATQLLNAACRGLATAGLVYVDAYPRPQAASAAEQHFGPLSLYLAAGFQALGTDDDGSVHVRKTL